MKYIYTTDGGLKIKYQHTNYITAWSDIRVLVARSIKYYTQQNVSLVKPKIGCETVDT
jgi:hypothetical protein